MKLTKTLKGKQINSKEHKETPTEPLPGDTLVNAKEHGKKGLLSRTSSFVSMISPRKSRSNSVLFPTKGESSNEKEKELPGVASNQEIIIPKLLIEAEVVGETGLSAPLPKEEKRATHENQEESTTSLDINEESEEQESLLPSTDRTKVIETIKSIRKYQEADYRRYEAHFKGLKQYTAQNKQAINQEITALKEENHRLRLQNDSLQKDLNLIRSELNSMEKIVIERSHQMIMLNNDYLQGLSERDAFKDTVEVLSIEVEKQSSFFEIVTNSIVPSSGTPIMSNDHKHNNNENSSTASCSSSDGSDSSYSEE